MKIKIYKVFLLLSFLAGIVSITYFALQKTQEAGTILMSAFIFAALGIQGYEKFKGFSYTLVIFAAATCSLCFPTFFIEINGYPSKKLIVPLLIIVMFGMGTHMNVKDFIGIIKTPKPIFIGLLCHYTLMPTIGFILAYTSNLPPEIAAGIILLGCSPSGMASNVMSYISGGNLSLSVTVTGLSTLLAPILTPLLMKLLAGQLVPVNFWEMLWHITQIVILPVLAGLIYNRFAYGKFSWFDRILPLMAMCAIPIIIVIVTASGRNALLSMGPILVLLILIHNLAGYFLGYKLSKFWGLREDEARTIAFEVGMQNAGLASGIALQMGRMATMGLASAIFGPVQNITASVLANWWKGKTIVQ